MTLKRMLAVTHEVSRTGAPINLLHLLRWISRNTDVEIHTLTLDGGELLEEFEELGPVTVLASGRPSKALQHLHTRLVLLGSRRLAPIVGAIRLKPLLRGISDFDLIYVNSMTSVVVLDHLDDDAHIVLHIHELQMALKGPRFPSLRERFVAAPDRWIACSGAVRDLLIDDIGLDPERVLMHYSFVDARQIAERTVPAETTAKLRESLDIPADAPIVMGTGTLEWRKGPDLFAQLAGELSRTSNTDAHFIWLGGTHRGDEWLRVRADIDRAGLSRVHFVESVEDPIPWFAMADVFALTSHEDPYPLVCLEHAALGNPVVTFRNGGMPELLERAGDEAAEGIVDHLDVAGMARQINRLLTDDALRSLVGTQLRETVLEQHDLEVTARDIYTDLVSLCDTPRGPQT